MTSFLEDSLTMSARRPGVVDRSHPASTRLQLGQQHIDAVMRNCETNLRYRTALLQSVVPVLRPERLEKGPPQCKQISTIRHQPETSGRKSDRMMQLITGHWMAQIVRAVAHYAIADKNRPKDQPPQPTSQRARAQIPTACSDCCAPAPPPVSLWVTPMDGFRPQVCSARCTAMPPARSATSPSSRPGPFEWLPWGKFIEAVRTGERQTLSALGKEAGGMSGIHAR